MNPLVYRKGSERAKNKLVRLDFMSRFNVRGIGTQRDIRDKSERILVKRNPFVNIALFTEIKATAFLHVRIERFIQHVQSFCVLESVVVQIRAKKFDVSDRLV